MTNPTPTKPTIKTHALMLLNLYGVKEENVKNNPEALNVFCDQLLQLVLDEVIIKDLEHTKDKCDKNWCYCSSNGINEVLKFMRERAREILK